MKTQRLNRIGPFLLTWYTVRPRDTRPQAARISTMHDFELGPKFFEMHVFGHFSFSCTILEDFSQFLHDFAQFLHDFVQFLHDFAQF